MSDADLLDRVRRRLASSPAPIDALVRASSGIADDAALAIWNGGSALNWSGLVRSNRCWRCPV